MKRLLFLLCWLPVASYAQTSFATIHGRVTTLAPGTKVYVKWHDAEHMTMDFPDSTENTSDGFTFRIPVEKGKGSLLMFLYGKKIGHHLYVEEGTISFTSDDPNFNKIAITGAPFARELDDFHHRLYDHPTLTGYYELRRKHYAAIRNKDSLTLSQTSPELQRMDSLRKELSLQWISDNRNSPIGVFIMYSTREPLYERLQPEEQQAVLDLLTPIARNNQLARYIQADINKELITGIGRKAPLFTQKDTLGKPVSLQDFRGKYVLVDFWASWCGPCRAENPNLVKAFQQYKVKGFTILGVSLEQPKGKTAWLNAIHKDQLTWTHVSDFQYWDNAVAKLYKVQGVPTNYLIGPDGIILARNLRGEELNKKLAELLR